MSCLDKNDRGKSYNLFNEKTSPVIVVVIHLYLWKSVLTNIRDTCISNVCQTMIADE